MVRKSSIMATTGTPLARIPAQSSAVNADAKYGAGPSPNGTELYWNSRPPYLKPQEGRNAVEKRNWLKWLSRSVTPIQQPGVISEMASLMLMYENGSYAQVALRPDAV